ncbi:MAG: hypothetical protein L3V56_05325 [Candidatus Magnetoovum sp. WYHC-5]|nr:hypothetical protein [Candidatus Magnetoovum sp. WYHC-5]
MIPTTTIIATNENDVARAIVFVGFAKKRYKTMQETGISKKTIVINDGYGDIYIHLNPLSNFIKIEVSSLSCLYLVYSKHVSSFFDDTGSQVLTYRIKKDKDSNVDKLSSEDINHNGTVTVNGFNLVAQPGSGSTFYVTLAHNLVLENYIDSPDYSGIVLYERSKYWGFRETVTAGDAYMESYYTGSNQAYLPTAGKITGALNARCNYVYGADGLILYEDLQIEGNNLGSGYFYISWNPHERPLIDWFTRCKQYLRGTDGKLIPDSSGGYQYEMVDSPVIASTFEEGFYKDDGYNWKYHSIIAIIGHGKALICSTARTQLKSPFGMNKDQTVSFTGTKIFTTYYWCASRNQEVIYSTVTTTYSGSTKTNKEEGLDNWQEELRLGDYVILNVKASESKSRIVEFNFSLSGIMPAWIKITSESRDYQFAQNCPNVGMGSGLTTSTAMLLGSLSLSGAGSDIQVKTKTVKTLYGNKDTMVWDTNQTIGSIYEYSYIGGRDINVLMYDNKDEDDCFIIFYKYTEYNDTSSYDKNVVPPVTGTAFGSISVSRTHKFYLSYKLPDNDPITEFIDSYNETRTGHYVVNGEFLPDYAEPISDNYTASGIYIYNASCQINTNFMVYTYCLADAYDDDRGYIRFTFTKRIIGLIAIKNDGYKKEFTFYDDDKRLEEFAHDNIAAIGVF